jgi:hypothetical protein
MKVCVNILILYFSESRDNDFCVSMQSGSSSLVIDVYSYDYFAIFHVFYRSNYCIRIHVCIASMLIQLPSANKNNAQ